VQQGDNALTSGALERALEAYQTASELDPLHPEAESKRLQVEQLIKQREERLAANQAALEHGAQLRTLAEQESTRGRYAEAIALLREALEVYNEVSDEFPVEATQRTRAVREIQAQIDSLRETLLANAQMLSGSGSDLDIVELLREKAKQFDRDALRLLLRSAYQEEVADLEASLLPRLESSAP
jgi:tetratricopeptide (TPR) repeat protein